jgi:hypothetical protein
MTYYEFSFYAHTRRALEEARQTLVDTWEFDPNDAEIRPSWGLSRFARLARRLRRMVFLRDKEDFHMFITGPEIYRSKAIAVIEAWEGYCDGGGYDFTYDPETYYTDDQIMLHTAKWKMQVEQDQRRYMASLPEDEQARIKQAMEDLASHIRTHESDE